MQIIINKPAYQNYHGRTFNAFFIGENGSACVPIEDGLIEFKPTEFFFFNLESEAQKAYDSKNWNSSNKTYDRLIAYCKAAGIKEPKVEYTCPS